MEGKELIFIEHNYVLVNIVGSAHALSLNIHNNFLSTVLFLLSLFYRGEKSKTQRNLVSCLRSCR